MDALLIKGSDDTPEVMFDGDKGIFSLSGNCYSDDPFSTFKPIFSWIDKYSAEPNKSSTIDIKLNYVNTASSKQITEMLMKFEKIKDKTAVKVNWHYDKMDEDMEYEGNTLSSIIKIEFDLIGY